MSNIELNAILYYADFLSLQHQNHPVTDNCKYFFIHGCPINSAYIVDLEPEYDPNDPYIVQASQEYYAISDKYDEDAAMSFIDDICSIKACGSVNAEQMLKCIHRFSSKYERKLAFNEYYEWKKQQYYSHITFNENGDPQETECTRYVKHAERGLTKRGLLKSAAYDGTSIEKQTEERTLSY